MALDSTPSSACTNELSSRRFHRRLIHPHPFSWMGISFPRIPAVTRSRNSNNMNSRTSPAKAARDLPRQRAQLARLVALRGLAQSLALSRVPYVSIEEEQPAECEGDGDAAQRLARRNARDELKLYLCMPMVASQIFAEFVGQQMFDSAHQGWQWAGGRAGAVGRLCSHP
jgi:hypothetical protein